MRTFIKTLTYPWFVFLFVILTFCGRAGAGQVSQDPIRSIRVYRSIGRVYMTYGQYEKAERFFQEALEKVRDLQEAEGEKAICLIDMATLYSYQERLDESADLFRRGLEAQAFALGREHPYAAHGLRMLSDVYRRQGNLDQAEETLENAMSVILKYHDHESRELSPFFLDLARLHMSQGDYESALEGFRAVLQKVEDNFGPEHLLTASVLVSMAECELRNRVLVHSEELIDRALHIQNRYYGPDHPRQVDAWLVKVHLCRLQGDFAGAETLIARAVRITARTQNVITLAAVHERIRQLRSEDPVLAAAVQ